MRPYMNDNRPLQTLLPRFREERGCDEAISSTGDFYDSREASDSNPSKWRTISTEH